MNMDRTLSLLELEPDTYVDSYGGTDEETLVSDHRDLVRPAQRVEQKLVAALQASPVLLSQMQKVKRPHDR